MPDRLKPEFRLLADSLRFPLLPEEVERIRQDLSQDLDWRVFGTLVERHQVGSLVYTNFQQLGSGLVPIHVMERLKNRHLRNSQANMALSVELVGIARRFAREGIKICPLKGLLLSQQVFGNLAIRDGGDLDILVPHVVLDQAERLLLAQGYRRIDPAFNLTPLQKQVYERLRHHYNYIGPNHWTPLELHWQIGSAYEMPVEISREMLARARQIEFLGAPFLSLTREDTLAFMIFHGSQHGWSRMKWLADLAALLRQDIPIDWECVLGVIHKMDLARPFSESVLLAHQLLGSQIPEPVQDLISRQGAGIDLRSFWMSALLANRDLSMHSGSLFRFRLGLYAVRMTPGMSMKIRRFSSYWFFPDDWHDFPLPDPLFPLYILFRPLFWLARQFLPAKRKSAHPAE